MSEKKEKMVKKMLELAKRHPKNVFSLGEHKITPTAQEFLLSEKDMKELSGKGCSAWIKEVKAKKA